MRIFGSQALRSAGRSATTMWWMMALPFVACAEASPSEGNDDLGSGAEPSESQQLETASQALRIGPNDVGVIKAANVNCPGEEIMIGLDNENTDNNNSRSGWVGATTGSANTYLRFCRIDGRILRRVRSSNAAQNYAVLQLGDTCPAGSVSVTRYFDNDDCDPLPLRACSPEQGEWSYGDIAPNRYGGNQSNNTWMKLCMFRASSSASAFSFPSIGGAYGVFGAAGLVNAMESGSVYTDDEDTDNNNSLSGDTAGSSTFLDVGSNTRMRMVRVR